MKRVHECLINLERTNPNITQLPPCQSDGISEQTMGTFSYKNKDLSLLLFLIPIAVYTAIRRKSKTQRATSSNNNDDSIDQFWLQRAHQLRLALPPPRLSQFRVVAVLLLDNGNAIFGSNDEQSSHISGAICAERAALLEFRTHYYGNSNSRRVITTVYIVSDAVSTPLPPGALCREYMTGHDAISYQTTRIVLQSANGTVWDTTLAQLYPYPSPYNRLSVIEQLERGRVLSEKLMRSKYQIVEGDVLVSAMSEELIQQLFQCACQAAQNLTRSEVISIHYGAAAIIRQRQQGISFVSASQLTTYEYGAAQDALCQLFPSVNTADDIVAVVQVDHFGVPHPPSAMARSVYAEHGMGRVPVIILVEEGEECRLSSATMEELMTGYTPNFRA